jgi:hypothetical protein
MLMRKKILKQTCSVPNKKNFFKRNLLCQFFHRRKDVVVGQLLGTILLQREKKRKFGLFRILDT